ncbi:hypothetical protein BS47DRAFT_1486123 [Hydnum rufescens UP504]|uniref:Uncharacterized protein n=1 Tax=Hydnum rufescens UP504 TaxID=1448309 RepID=A0A9P6DWF7_9AGAM|nr:hypothetical protein BS47DRAFT_1486123 [Hydnum rufescens UP504]
MGVLQGHHEALRLPSFRRALTSLLLSSPLANAYITGIAGPTHTLHPGQKFNVTFFTEDYIQNNVQYYAIFGIAPASRPSDPTLSGISTRLGNMPKSFGTPTGAAESYFLKTAVLGTIGASETALLLTFNTTVRISPK